MRKFTTKETLCKVGRTLFWIWFIASFCSIGGCEYREAWQAILAVANFGICAVVSRFVVKGNRTNNK